jgi:hypothetical protein
VRVTSVSNQSERDFFLDYLAVDVHYGDPISILGPVDPSAEAAGPTGDGDGFEITPSGAFADGGTAATDVESGTANGNNCGDPDRDRHVFEGYGVSIASGASIHGIDVRIDAWADPPGPQTTACVELSWDGGVTWTPARPTALLGATEQSYWLGGDDDDWGRAWAPSDLADGSFAVRVSNTGNDPTTDYYLDWLPVRVHYTPP